VSLLDQHNEQEREWAIRVHCDVKNIPGPHLLPCSSQRAAHKRAEWWETNRPDVRVELLSRVLITTYGPWENQ